MNLSLRPSRPRPSAEAHPPNLSHGLPRQGRTLFGDEKDRHVGISLVIGARTLHGPTGGSVFKDEDVAPGGHGPPLSCIAITSRHTGISGE